MMDNKYIFEYSSLDLKINIGIFDPDNFIASVGDEQRESTFDENKQREISEYYKLTGFPELEATSLMILEVAKIAMIIAALKANVNLKFSGYDQSCSVGRNLALPGSDLDGWYIVIDGDEVSKQIFYQELINALNPQVIDVDSINEIQIVLFSEVMQLGNETDFINNKRTQNVALATDILKNEWCIVDNLNQAEKSKIRELKLAQKNHFLLKGVHGEDIKDKLKRRVELSRQFQNLTQEEQYLIIQIIKTINRGEDFNFNNNSKNPNLNVLWLLFDRNILYYSDKNNKFIASWLTDGKLKEEEFNKWINQLLKKKKDR